MSIRSIVCVTTLTCLSLVAGSLVAQDAGKSYYIRSFTLVVARVKGTNEFLAYSKTVGKWNSFTFPEGVTAVSVLGTGVCMFQLEGEAITEVVAVDLKSNWCTSKLSGAAKKSVPIISEDVAVCVVDGTAHAFSGELGKWDSTPAAVTPQVFRDIALIEGPDSIAVFSSATGKWAVAQTTK
jgi:hypothetical protein